MNQTASNLEMQNNIYVRRCLVEQFANLNEDIDPQTELTIGFDPRYSSDEEYWYLELMLMLNYTMEQNTDNIIYKIEYESCGNLRMRKNDDSDYEKFQYVALHTGLSNMISTARGQLKSIDGAMDLPGIKLPLLNVDQIIQSVNEKNSF